MVTLKRILANDRTDFFCIAQLKLISEEGRIGKKFKDEAGAFFAGPEFFDIFDYHWLAGNPKKALAEPNMAVLTQSEAEKLFDNWHQAMGKQLKLNNQTLVQVSGILKDLPDNSDFQKAVFVSYSTIHDIFPENDFTNWGSVSSDVQCYILLPAGTTEASFNRLLASFLQKHHPKNKNTYKLQPLSDLHFNPNYAPPSFRSITKQTITSLELIGLFILVIACINFVNLATAQALGRAKEAGVRKVLGSNRSQLIWQFLGETFIVVLIAVLGAVIMVQLVLPYVQPLTNLPEKFTLLAAPGVLPFLIGTILIVTFLSGIYPALILSGFQPVQALKSKITLQAVGGINLRKALVVLQFSVAQILIIATLIAIYQMDFIRHKDLGFNQRAVLLVEIPDDSLAQTKMHHLKNQFMALPNVERVSFNFSAPLSGSSSSTNFGFTSTTKDEDFPLNIKAADADYFSTFQLQFAAGRPYAVSDTIREVVVNEMLLEKVGIRNPQDAIGKSIKFYGRQYPVVGVVKDFHHASLRQPIVPIAMASDKSNFRQVALKVAPGNLKETQKQVEKIWSGAFPDYVYEATFLDERIAEFYEEDAKLSQLFKIFAGIAIFIGCLGLYGLVSFVAVQKTKEIGIRKVLGASLTNIVALLSKDFIKLVLLANIIAWPLAWWAMQKWLQDFTYRTEIGWWMFAVAGLGALIIALITVSMQAIKAGLANPVNALKSE